MSNEELTNKDLSLLEHYIDTMTEYQKAITEPQQRVNQLRQDAKTDGFNVDALNLLLQIRCKNYPDGGIKVLSDLVSYAISTGTKLDEIVPVSSSVPVQERSDPAIWPEDQYRQAEDLGILGRATLPIQLGVGALLGVAMLWYLR